MKKSVFGKFLLCILAPALILLTLACGAPQTATSQKSGSNSTPTTTPNTSSGTPTSPDPAPSTDPAPTQPAPSTGIPTPPSTAKVFSRLEEASGWDSCGNVSCAGGSGQGSYWMAQNQTTPSMDGNSMELARDGVWANALWWKHVGADNSARNFLWDFYFRLDDASTTVGQALEFDVFQFTGGYRYMIGTECSYGSGFWDTWDELNAKWVHTTIPCKPFSPNTWHHMQLYVTTDHSTHTYKYVTLRLDGTSFAINKTHSARNLGWADNAGVQYQLDVDDHGSMFHEWTDKSTLTMW